MFVSKRLTLNYWLQRAIIANGLCWRVFAKSVERNKHPPDVCIPVEKAYICT